MYYQKWLVFELRKELNARRISSEGDREALVSRLQEDDERKESKMRTWSRVVVLLAALLLLLLCGFAVTKTAPALVRGAGRAVEFIRQPAVVVATSEPQAQTVATAVPTEAQPQMAADLPVVNSEELTYCQEWGLGIMPDSPVEKWNQTMNPNGSMVPSSCTLREADDTNPRGWGPATIPEGVVGHLWLDKSGSKLAVTIVGPAVVGFPYLTSRGTYYIGENPFLGHEGQWTYSVWSADQTPACPWVTVGESVIVCDLQMAQAAPTPSTATSASATPAPTTATAPATTIDCPLFDGVQSELQTEGGATYCKVLPRDNALTGLVPENWILDWSFEDQHGRAATGEKVTFTEGTFWSVQ